MHYLYFVKVPHTEGTTTSEEARSEATNELDSQNFVSDSNGYFGSSKSDWYVVGGRWSGTLQLATMKKDFFEEAKKAIPSSSGYGYSNDEVESNKDALQKIWEECGGTGENPYNRDNYNNDGAEDDAMRITPELIETLKTKYADTEIFDADQCEEITCADLTDADIGDWLVVIDYHN